jgi:hypothetical protein
VGIAQAELLSDAPAAVGVVVEPVGVAVAPERPEAAAALVAVLVEVVPTVVAVVVVR